MPFDHDEIVKRLALSLASIYEANDILLERRQFLGMVRDRITDDLIIFDEALAKINSMRKS